ncbi:MAG: MFS transporter [Bifidobacterium dentium]|nr:MFS transporter [Bifidobacterium dentium]
MVNLLLAVIYVAFISLGLPDAVLGAAWPTMSTDLGAPVSWAGGISMVISAGTIVSALMSDRMTLRFGAGKVTAISVALTALALFGFSMAPSYWVLILFAVPYGLGAGGVDAALNNYVAIHYESHHMSWLHAMWGIGALTGPYIMGYALNAGQGWSWGYRYISILQIVLTAILIFSLPLWKQRVPQPQSIETEPSADITEQSATEGLAQEPSREPLGIRGVLAIRGAREILIMFFCYCALEQTAMLWASSYMALGEGIDKTTAAMWASLFCIGITVGRLLSGFVTMKFNDPTMIRMGQVLVLLGVVVMLLPLPQHLGTIVGLMVVGLGCAPIYPCVIHSTPMYFGEDKSQAIVGMQMACAYVGSMCMPPVFGLIAQHVTITLFPWYLVVFLVLMIVMHESLRRKCGGQRIG